MAIPSNPNVQRMLAHSIRSGNVSMHKFGSSNNITLSQRQQRNGETISSSSNPPAAYAGFAIHPRSFVSQATSSSSRGYSNGNASSTLQAFRAANGDSQMHAVDESQLIDVIGQSYALKADVRWYRTHSKAQRAFRAFNKKLSDCCPDPACKHNRSCEHCQLRVRDAAEAYSKVYDLFFAVLGINYSTPAPRTVPPVAGDVQWLYGNGDGTATVVTSAIAPTAPAGEAVIPFYFGAGFSIANRPGDLVMFNNIKDSDSVVVSSRGHLLDTLFIVSGNPAPYTWTLTALSIAAYTATDSVQFATYVDLAVIQAALPPTPVNLLTLGSRIVTLTNVNCPDQTIAWTATIWASTTFSIVAALSHLSAPHSERCGRCGGDYSNDDRRSNHRCLTCARTVVHMSPHLSIVDERTLRGAVTKAASAFETRVAPVAAALALPSTHHSNSSSNNKARVRNANTNNKSRQFKPMLASSATEEAPAHLSPLLSMPLAYMSMLVKHDEALVKSVRDARVSLIDDASAHLAEKFERHWIKWMENDRAGMRFDTHRRQIVLGKNSDVLRMNRAQLKYVARVQARDAVAHWLRTQAFFTNTAEDDNSMDMY